MWRVFKSRLLAGTSLIAVLSLTLAACGGGNGDGDEAPTVPQPTTTPRGIIVTPPPTVPLAFSPVPFTPTLAVNIRGETLTFTLDEVGGSGQSGTATLTVVDGKTEIVIDITPGPAGAIQPTSIRRLNCDNLGGSPQLLEDVADGKSTTLINTPIPTLLKLAREEGLAITVQKSRQEIDIDLVCGNFPRTPPPEE